MTRFQNLKEIYKIDSSNNLNNDLKRLAEKLEYSGNHPQYVGTVLSEYYGQYETCSSLFCEENEVRAKVGYYKGMASAEFYLVCRFSESSNGRTAVIVSCMMDPAPQPYLTLIELCNNALEDAFKDRNLVRETAPKPIGGCFVATSVYGTYDCPQVWVLRRYRDSKLASSRQGRAFIKAYYAVSPTFVRILGDKEWFKNACRSHLDVLVDKCRANGFSDLPYKDISW